MRQKKQLIAHFITNWFASNRIRLLGQPRTYNQDAPITVHYKCFFASTFGIGMVIRIATIIIDQSTQVSHTHTATRKHYLPIQ